MKLKQYLKCVLTQNFKMSKKSHGHGNGYALRHLLAERKLTCICFLQVVLLLSTVLMNYHSAIADTSTTRTYMIGGAKYTKSQILRDFVSIAFSDTLWNEQYKSTNAVDAELDIFSQLVRSYDLYSAHNIDPSLESEFEKEAPWLWPYVARKDGFPRHNTLTKWTKGISVGIDWPAYNKFDYKDSSGLPYIGTIRTPPESYEVIQRQVEKILPDLEKLTGLPVKFVGPKDPIDQTEDFARIRIIPSGSVFVAEIDGKTRAQFKRNKSPSLSLRSKWSFIEYIDDLFGAISFTPYSRSQVGGFLLPEADSSIGLVVCNPMTEAGDALAKAMVTECLVRALGIPEMLSAGEKAVLGNWNKAYDKIAKTTALDNWKDVRPSGRVTFLTSKELGDYNVADRLYDGLQAYDRSLVSLLYCPLLKPGMDKYQVLDKLLSSDECWKRIEKLEE
ncbi:MAG: hypothetical protein PSY14_17295 [bacterium]|nr:hypothetical protein [bacterium]